VNAVASNSSAAIEREGRKWWVLAAVSLGMFMALLDATIVNIAVPAIIVDLNTTITKISWVLNAYNLAMAVLFLSFGRFADRLGQKRVFIAGIVVFTLFSLACGFAPSIEWLIVFRVLQAIGAAAMAPISLSILLGVFPQRQHGTAVGIWGALGAVAAALGPSLGGVLVEKGSWHWIFFINVPIGAIAVAMALVFVPERRRAESNAGFDLTGIVVSVAGLFALTLALIQGNSWGWSSARIIALFAIALAALPTFMFWELRARSPMFDLRLLRIRSFTAANTGQMFIGVVMGGTLLLFVIFMVSVLGYSELRAALAITPMPVTALLLGPLVGRLVDRIGPRFPTALGALFFVAGLLLLSRLDATSSAWDATWRTIFLGAGVGLSMPTLAAAAMGSLPDEAGGVGSGALATFRQIGFVLGVAILVAIFSHTVAAQVDSATRAAVRYVNSQTQLPAPAKALVIASLRRNAAAAASASGNPGARLQDPLQGIPQASAGTAAAAAQRALTRGLTRIYKAHVAKAFRWPYYAAAIAALLALPFGLLSGRRLGAHAGHHELSRSQRQALANGTGGR
jgi:EmrB/QacA subfamily drug resistance transporter